MLDTAERWRRVQSMRRRGMSEQSIAHALGITPSALSYWLATNRLPRVGHPTPRKRDPRRTKALKLLRRGWPVKRIAEEVGATQSKVTEWRRLAGLKSSYARHDTVAILRDYATMTAPEVAHKYGTTPAVIYVIVSRAKYGQVKKFRLAVKNVK